MPPLLLAWCPAPTHCSSPRLTHTHTHTELITHFASSSPSLASGCRLGREGVEVNLTAEVQCSSLNYLLYCFTHTFFLYYLVLLRAHTQWDAGTVTNLLTHSFTHILASDPLPAFPGLKSQWWCVWGMRIGAGWGWRINVIIVRTGTLIFGNFYNLLSCGD